MRSTRSTIAALSACAVLAACSSTPTETAPTVHIAEAAKPSVSRALNQALPTTTELATILEWIGEGFYAVDREWRIRRFNSEAARHFAREPRDVVGRKLWDVFPGARETPLGQLFLETMERRQPVKSETPSVVIAGRWLAAVHAMSDVYAMGGDVLFALAVAGFPRDMDKTIVAEVFRGGAEKVAEAGGVIAGGHTVIDNEPKYGLCVTGRVHPDRVLIKGGLRAGDRVFLSKALGTGVITTAGKDGGAPDGFVSRAPTFLGGDKLPDGKSVPNRAALAAWMTSPTNPYFARATVTRTWSPSESS